MLTFTRHLLFDHFQFALIHGPNIPGSYAILLLQHQTLLPSPVTSTAGCCFCFGLVSSFFLELFLHWSPVAYWAPTKGSSFQCPICLAFHTVYEVLKAKILKWSAVKLGMSLYLWLVELKSIPILGTLISGNECKVKFIRLLYKSCFTKFKWTLE